MNKHTDERGFIDDLLVTEKGAVTHITFTKGAVRGNHYHKKTVQADFILEGKLLCATQYGEVELNAGDFMVHQPLTKHAYKALEDSVMVTCAYGPRKGEDYSVDTFRLNDDAKLL